MKMFETFILTISSSSRSFAAVFAFPLPAFLPGLARGGRTQVFVACAELDVVKFGDVVGGCAGSAAVVLAAPPGFDLDWVEVAAIVPALLSLYDKLRHC